MYLYRKRSVVLFAVALALLAAVASSTHTLADDTDCAGSLGAIRVDNLRVPADAVCTLNGTIVNGNIFVEANASLYAHAVQVTGNLQAGSAARVNVDSGSAVGGSVQIVRSGAARIQSASIEGDLFFDDNHLSLSATNNIIGGNLQAFNNTGGVSINGNTIDGNLQCKENSPPPTGAGNIVNGDMEDQCTNFGNDPPPAPTNTSAASTHTPRSATNTPRAATITPLAPTSTPQDPTAPPPVPTQTLPVGTHTPQSPTQTPASIIDQEAPTVRWTTPVLAGERYDIRAGEQVLLEAVAHDNDRVRQVEFFRWDAVKKQYTTIGTLARSPFRATISASSLNPAWNQVFVIAVDLAGNRSDYPFIWLYKLVDGKMDNLIYLPFTGK